MYQAISTACLYPLETEKSLKILLDLGLRNFEIFINTESEFTPEFFSLLKSMTDKKGASVYSVHFYTSGLEPFMFFSNYRRRFNDSLEQYRRYFSLISGIGAKAAVFHGDRKGGNLSIDDFCEHFSKLSDAARDEGIVLAQENVARCRSGRPENILEMKQRLGDKIKFVLDVKQSIRAESNPFEMADAMSGSIIAVHYSDSTNDKDCLLPGKGNFDSKLFCRKLASCGYDGPLIIEVYSNSFNNYKEIKEATLFLSRNM